MHETTSNTAECATPAMPHLRALSVGAEPISSGGTHFRLWAPESKTAEILLLDGRHAALDPVGSGYFAGHMCGAEAGLDYVVRLDAGRYEGPDPASRYQPEGPLGPSRIVDPNAYQWHDAAWPGLSPRGQVLYEMHAGTFTPAGTWPAATGELALLAELGITAIELMPVTEYPGTFGWSYDPAQLFAPSHNYGTPDDFRTFVDVAHGLGIGVLLDVIYNHLGAVGERLLRSVSNHYFSTKYKTEWGAALNFDEPHAEAVRQFVLDNVNYWIREFHLDGYRIDATQSIVDRSPRHILLDISRTARAAVPRRHVLMIAENEPQQAKLLRRGDSGGYEFDAAWNDDFHHAALVRLTGHREAYYADYRGSADEFVAGARWGYLYQGQRYRWQDKPRGTPALDLEAWRFVNYLQNHDQLANSASGARIHELTSPGKLRAMSAVLLLAPQTPLLFQGQEFGASSPFLYFNDCPEEQQAGVRQGRADFLSQFRSLATARMQARLPDPCDVDVFRRSQLDHGERASHAECWNLHCDLIRLRRKDPVLSRQDATEIHGAALTADAFLLRYLPAGGDTRLFIVNFGSSLDLDSIAQPLIAPPDSATWQLLWSSEDPQYGGSGTPDFETAHGWHLPAESALLWKPLDGTSPP